MGESHDEDFLTKKMEEMRKKNEEILRRHQEIEQDKMCADQFSNSAKEKRKNLDPEKVVPRASVVRTPRNKATLLDTQPNISPKEMEEKRYHRLSDSCGPPPDPNYNFLSDRSRTRSESSNEGNWRDTDRSWGQSRRHPTNYGGSDFKNVKSTMEKHKSSYKKNQADSVQNAVDLTMQMTGRQRIQYEEWKKERERVDQARIDRQRGSDGSWRREWDSHKHKKESNIEDEEYEHEKENPHNKFQSQNIPVRSLDLNSNSSDFSQRSQIRSPNDDIERFPRSERIFRPSGKSSRVISDGDGRLSITLTNNNKHPQESDKRDWEPRGKALVRKKMEAVSPRTKSSSWTFLLSESSSPPPDSNYVNLPKPLYPGWQTGIGNENSKNQEANMQIGLVNMQNQSESPVGLSKKFNLLSTNQIETIASPTDKEFIGIGGMNIVKDCANEYPKILGNVGKIPQNDSDIYYSDDSPEHFQEIEIPRSGKPCVQEVKCKLVGLKIAEEDDEWEDMSEEEVAGSCSDED